MNTITPRPGVMDITPYVGGGAAIGGPGGVIKLASNEGALGPSPKAMDAYRSAAQSLHRYPDGGCLELRRGLAEKYGLDIERIVCGAGSDELIGLLARAYSGPGDEVLYSEHGFLMYPIAARTAGAKPVTAPEKDLTADVDALLGAVTERTSIVFLANPNNPTGTYLSRAEMKRLRGGLPQGVLLVIDAAYAEFAEVDDYGPGTAMVEAGANVVMMRTFSKIYGLGGARLGWAYCPGAVADVLNRVRNPFNVAAPAQAAGLAALADQAFTEKARRHNLTWRRWTADRLEEMGLETVPSIANFLLVRFPQGKAGDNRELSAQAADGFLKSQGLIVRRMESYGLPEFLRVTIGREDEMKAFADALSRFMEGEGQ